MGLLWCLTATAQLSVRRRGKTRPLVPRGKETLWLDGMQAPCSRHGALAGRCQDIMFDSGRDISVDTRELVKGSPPDWEP